MNRKDLYRKLLAEVSNNPQFKVDRMGHSLSASSALVTFCPITWKAMSLYSIRSV